MRDYQIVVDVETFPMDGAADFLDPLPVIEYPDLDVIQPAGNVKQPELVAKSIGDRKRKAMEAYEEAVAAQAAQWQALIDGCALDLDLLRIVCVSYMAPTDTTPVTLVCRTEGEEREALEMFWRDTKGADYVTFNGLDFDLPVMMRRAQYQRVAYSMLSLDRYRTTHIDLLQRLTFNKPMEKKPGHKRSLQFYMARFGISYADISTGKDIAALVKADDWEGVRAHCEADVRGTLQLARRLGLIQQAQLVAEGAF